MSKRVDYGSTAICAGGKYAELYSRAMKFAAMSLKTFAHESGYLTSFCNRQYIYTKKAAVYPQPIHNIPVHPRRPEIPCFLHGNKSPIRGDEYVVCHHGKMHYK